MKGKGDEKEREDIGGRRGKKWTVREEEGWRERRDNGAERGREIMLERCKKSSGDGGGDWMSKSEKIKLEIR